MKPVITTVAFLSLAIFATLFQPLPADAQIEWTERIITNDFIDAFGVCAADMDGDGDLDVFGASYHAGFRIWENVDGYGIIWRLRFSNYNFHPADRLLTADFDADGDPDMIGAENQGDRIVWWENVDGGDTWTPRFVDSAFTPIDLLVEDMDGDLDVDVISWSGSGQITWWENTTGTGLEWTQHTITNSFRASAVAAGDVDNDGDLDVSAGMLNGIQRAWWENLNGSGLNWTIHLFDPIEAIGVGDAEIADLDDDGDGDFVFGGTELFYWWENLDGAGLDLDNHYLSSPTADELFLADVDGDMNHSIDIVASHGTDNIRWCENRLNVDGTWISHPVGSANGIDDVWAGDINGDGTTDILAASDNDESIIIWFQNGSPDHIEITLVPAVEPMIAPQGGSFTYSATLISNLPGPQNVIVWTEAVLPNGVTYGPIAQTPPMPFTPNTNITIPAIVQAIPVIAPLGSYTFHMKAGLNPTIVLGEHSFPFEVVPANNATANPEMAWSSPGFTRAFAAHDQGENISDQIPDVYSLEQAFPNPFNAATTLVVSLPNASDLTVTVYNVSGQRVVTLADGQVSTGSHSYTFDATGLASGLYFVQATVPGQMNEVQKVMLVR
jgi:FG-GAP-like repeat/Secretion system C-terminal sorting domain